MTVLYQDDVPVAVSAVVVSVQHDADVSVETIRKTVKEEVIRKVIPEKYLAARARGCSSIHLEDSYWAGLRRTPA